MEIEQKELGNVEDLSGFPICYKQYKQNIVRLLFSPYSCDLSSASEAQLKGWNKIADLESNRRVSKIGFNILHNLNEDSVDYLQRTDNRIDELLAQDKSKYIEFAERN